MSRFRAAALHFAISLLIATVVFLVIFFVWYPGALFERVGGKDLFLLIVGVDVTLGPLITLIIFRSGKKGLKFDLATIAVIQLLALTYGVWVLYESRPAYIVFIKDRFELARANDIAPAERAKAKAPFDELPVTGPRVVGARLPTDPDEQFRIMMSASAGLDIQGFPQYFVPYDEVRREALAKSAPFGELRKFNPDNPEAVQALLKRLGGREERLRFLPMRAEKTDVTAVLDASTGELLHIAALRPWEFK
jgi:hypothetical protein